MDIHKVEGKDNIGWPVQSDFKLTKVEVSKVLLAFANHNMNGFNFVGYCQFPLSWRVQSTNSSNLEIVNFFIIKKNIMATSFEPHECVILVQSTKIATHENTAIHSNLTSV